MPEGTPSLLPASKKCTKHVKMPFNLPLASPFTPGKCNPRTGIWIRELGAHWYPDDGSAHRRAGERGSQPESRTLRVRVLLTIQRATRQGHFHTRASACRDALAEVLRGRGPWDDLSWESWGRKIANGDAQARRGAIPRYCAHVSYEPTLTWAWSNAHISWRQRVGVMGGGTDSELEVGRMRVMTDSWVRAAMMRSEPRRQNGRSQGSLRPHRGGRQVAISRAKTRLSSLTQVPRRGFPSSLPRRLHPAGAVWT